MTRLVILSKSPASPAIRREHALASLATEDGIDVIFIERPSDIRMLRANPSRWLGDLIRPRLRRGDWGDQVSPGVIAPGHRGRLAAGISERLIGRLLRTVTRPGDVVCAMVPWDWAAVESLSGVRRVFDCADDWPALIPSRSRQIGEMVRRAGVMADQVVVASPKLAPLFAPRDVMLIRNAASEDCLSRPTVQAPGTVRAVYVGTLTERFDTALIEASLVHLPHLRIDLFGPCAYAGHGSRPTPELSALLARHSTRLIWHGEIARDAVPGAIDAADVGLLPFRAELARGDIMKVYDYAARGRPTVSSAGVVDRALGRVPGMFEAGSVDAFAKAVEVALRAPMSARAEARAWAEANDWSARWPSWRGALFGQKVGM